MQSSRCFQTLCLPFELSTWRRVRSVQWRLVGLILAPVASSLCLGEATTDRVIPTFDPIVFGILACRIAGIERKSSGLPFGGVGQEVGRCGQTLFRFRDKAVSVQWQLLLPCFWSRVIDSQNVQSGCGVQPRRLTPNPVRGVRDLPLGEFVQRGWRGELPSGDRWNRSVTASATRRKTGR